MINIFEQKRRPHRPSTIFNYIKVVQTVKCVKKRATLVEKIIALFEKVATTKFERLEVSLQSHIHYIINHTSIQKVHPTGGYG